MYENLKPTVGVITEIRADTPDVKTFRVVAKDSLAGGADGESNKTSKKCFEHMPGQCAMLSVPGVGEAMFSVTSSPTDSDYCEFSIKKCGSLTSWLHYAETGQEILVRGPLGNHFPVESSLKGRNLVFIAGGIGIAPLRSVIRYCLYYRADYGGIDVVYGSRTADDLVNYSEIIGEWTENGAANVHLTVDGKCDGWNGHVGFVPSYVKELGFNPDSVFLVCGPPVMIKFTLAELLAAGVKKENIYTTMELKMKCGVGKCGRCNIGSKYVCKDGPVFRFDELDRLPDEY